MGRTLDLVDDFHAAGDNVDDTGPIDDWAAAIQATGKVGTAPPGRFRYKRSTSPFTKGGYKIRGAGHMGLNAKNPWLMDRGTYFIPDGGLFKIQDTRAIDIAGFGIMYPTPAPDWVPAIMLDGVAGSSDVLDCNQDSRIDNILILGASVGFQTGSAVSYHKTRCRIEGARQSSVLLNEVTSPGSGDSKIYGNWYSGQPPYGHARILGGGGLDMSNNKFNGGAIGIAVVMGGTKESFAPAFFNNNSIEGVTQFGFLFQKPPGVAEVAGNIGISNNEIVGGITIMDQQGGGQWFLDGHISGNRIYGLPWQNPIVNISGSKNLSVGCNRILTFNSVSVRGITFSTTCIGCAESGNFRGPNVT